MICVEKLSVRAGEFHLREASFQVPPGGYGMLMGKTGSGKTTLLETIAGLKRASGGRILLGGRDVTQLKPAERNIGYVPQDGALFANMSIRNQLGFALTIRKVRRAEIAARVTELASLLEIETLLDRSIQGLSGGEKQRIALGRALAFRPNTLLLDEPLSALDHETREQMYMLLRLVRQETGVTILHVTHNSEEAARLADVLFRIENGQIVQRPVQTGESPAGNGRPAGETGRPQGETSRPQGETSRPPGETGRPPVDDKAADHDPHDKSP